LSQWNAEADLLRSALLAFENFFGSGLMIF
jgi:hypothetical protein